MPAPHLSVRLILRPHVPASHRKDMPHGHVANRNGFAACVPFQAKMPGPSTILCVDDDDVALLVRRKVFEEAGSVVFTATTASKALAFFQSRPGDH
jgi:PleD family two-component response regulator